MECIESEVGRNTAKQDKYSSTLQQDLDALLEACVESGYLDMLAIWMTKSGDTALHVAALHGAENIFDRIVGLIETKPEICMKILSAKSKSGDTALHCAASRGSLTMCQRIIIDEGYYSLVHIRNNQLETPLFLAALHGHKETFLFLHSVSVKCALSSGSPWRRTRGETILHCTLEREYFDLSFQIIQRYQSEYIATAVNERGITPLHVLASKPSAFKSGTNFRWWSKLLYYCAIVEPLQVDEHMFPQNYRMCYINLRFMKNVFGLQGFESRDIKKIKEKHVWSSQIMDEIVRQIVDLDQYARDGTDPTYQDPNYKRVENFSMMNDKLKTVSSSDEAKNRNEDQQNQHDIGRKLQELYADLKNLLQYDADKPDDCITLKKEKVKEMEIMTVLLTAAKNGVLEIVQKFLDTIPAAIHEITTDKKNILLVAAENRQPHIIQTLKNRDVWNSLVQIVDNEGNNILHLAAKVSTQKAWQIAGSAMQMQWEIKWYEFLKDIVPPHLIFQPNNKEVTPGEIFDAEHEQLVKDGSEWLKSTSESCSVVAALIAGVSFATSSSMPGGANEQTGKPNLEGQPAFNVFAITSLVALCFSVTALVMFLSILTSRQQPTDFRRDLPFKLLLGLSSLFVSIACMLISFCAAYFFVLKDKMHNMEFIIIYAATCLPVSFYAVAQFPLYWDLLRAIFTKVPHRTQREQ